MRHRITRLLFAMTFICITIPVRSQTPAFEASSIKPNASVGNTINNRFGPEQFSWTNVTLRTLIENLYWLKDYQIIGAPNWVNTDKWDVIARTDGPTTMQQKTEMARTLLADRFGLKFH